MIRSFILLALATGWAHSATVLVPGGSWSTFSIDMDGNGQIDFAGTNIHFGYVEGTFYSDRLNTPITGPVSIVKERGFFVDPSTPQAAGLNGTYTVTSLLRSNNNMTDAGYGYFTFYNSQPQQSYVSLWVSNAGNSGDPVTLLGVHVDARDYIANNANPIKFHYGVYGPLTDAAGNNTVTVDFANLSIPEPSALSLLVMGIGGVIALRRVRRKADSV